MRWDSRVYRVRSCSVKPASRAASKSSSTRSSSARTGFAAGGKETAFPHRPKPAIRQRRPALWRSAVGAAPTGFLWTILQSPPDPFGFRCQTAAGAATDAHPGESSRFSAQRAPDSSPTAFAPGTSRIKNPPPSTAQIGLGYAPPPAGWRPGAEAELPRPELRPTGNDRPSAGIFLTRPHPELLYRTDCSTQTASAWCVRF